MILAKNTIPTENNKTTDPANKFKYVFNGTISFPTSKPERATFSTFVTFLKHLIHQSNFNLHMKLKDQNAYFMSLYMYRYHYGLASN